MATCTGCSRELYEIERANRAASQKRTDAYREALACIGARPGTEVILGLTEETGIVVASTSGDPYFPFAVDVFRPPTAGECDPDQTDPFTGRWVLIDQYICESADGIRRLMSDGVEYLASL